MYLLAKFVKNVDRFYFLITLLAKGHPNSLQLFTKLS